MRLIVTLLTLLTFVAPAQAAPFPQMVNAIPVEEGTLECPSGPVEVIFYKTLETQDAKWAKYIVFSLPGDSNPVAMYIDSDPTSDSAPYTVLFDFNGDQQVDLTTRHTAGTGDLPTAICDAAEKARVLRRRT